MDESKEMLEFKYKTLLRTIMDGATYRKYREDLGVGNDDEVFMVVKILEPDLYAERFAELKPEDAECSEN